MALTDTCPIDSHLSSANFEAHTVHNGKKSNNHHGKLRKPLKYIKEDNERSALCTNHPLKNKSTSSKYSSTTKRSIGCRSCQNTTRNER